MQHRFTSTTFLLAGALILWLADFTFVYAFAAVACARGFADVQMLGLPLVPVVTTVATLGAGVATVWLLRRGYRTQQTIALDEHTRFIGFVTLATSVIALVALLMLILPPLMVRTCAQP